MNFGEKLQILRKKSSLSQEEFAYKLNVSRQAVSRWENDQGFPETEKIVQISKMFNVSLDYLLKDESESNDKNTENGFYVSKETVHGFISYKRNLAKKNSFALLILIFSLVFPLLLPNTMGTILFLVAAGSSISIWVALSFEEKKYENLKYYPLLFDDKFIKDFTASYPIHKKKYIKLNILSVILITLGLISGIFIEEILKLTDDSYYSIFIICIAIAVSLFTFTSSISSAYNFIINNDNYNSNRLIKKKEWIYESTMCLAIFIFLGIGFIWGAWHPGWLIFPITAILTELFIRFKYSK